MNTAAYQGREQTAAKHFILRRYLQALTFKILQSNFATLTYVDGFSGPWKSQADDFSDTSFKIAIDVLKDAQQRVLQQGKRKLVQCFFVEEDPTIYRQLHAAVTQYHDPHNGFYVHTSQGPFEDSIDEIMKVVGTSFALTFIDPTGWTGYEFSRIERILKHRPGEVLLNYMKSFIDRFTSRDDHPTVRFEGILGSNWQSRLDETVPRDEAVQALFNSEFERWGGTNIPL